MSEIGVLYIMSAPSGAGKSSLIDAILAEKRDWKVKVSVSHTTRAPRQGERDGEHYHFVKTEEFKRLIKENAFFEWAEVFGNYYGTSQIEIKRELLMGCDIILDIDWQGARQLRKIMPDLKSIFILPPDHKELKSRLEKRGQDSLEVIEKRMASAQQEISHCDEYDYIIVNDNFDSAVKELSSIFSASRNERGKQLKKHKKMLQQLLKA